MANNNEDYWLRRSNMMYYKYIDYLVRGLASNAKSLIDIGSANAQYIENFDWIDIRHTLDLKEPYSSTNVFGFKMDFLEFTPKQKYDFVLCLQVLEHIPRVKEFTQKLFEIGDHVIISVPYKWEAGSSREHIHDPIDFNKLKSWTNREPTYHIIVKEPLYDNPKSRRLICYYHPNSKEFDLFKAKQRAESIAFNDLNKNMTIIKNTLNLIEKLNDEITFKQNYIQNIYKSKVKEYQILINELTSINELIEQRETQYENIIRSKSWRVIQSLRNIIRK